MLPFCRQCHYIFQWLNGVKHRKVNKLLTKAHYIYSIGVLLVNIYVKKFIENMNPDNKVFTIHDSTEPFMCHIDGSFMIEIHF